MQLEGWKVTVVPESVVYHVGGGTLPATSPFKLYLNFRNNRLMLSNNLSKTFALEFLKAGLPEHKAALKGHRKANRVLTFRQLLDAASAAVYLLTFKADCFKAVLKAYKDSTKLMRKPAKSEVEDYLRSRPATAQVRGIYPKWIILQSILKGDKVFESIRNTMQLK
jgi:hypothetical protein